MIKNLNDELKELSTKMMVVAKEYRDYRSKYSECKYNVNRMLAVKIPELMKTKKGIGVEMAMTMSLNDKEFDTQYKGFIYYEARFKGTERIFEAIKTRIMTIQSQMKFYRDQESTY
jgi:hypothetical protein